MPRASNSESYDRRSGTQAYSDSNDDNSGSGSYDETFTDQESNSSSDEENSGSMDNETMDNETMDNETINETMDNETMDNETINETMDNETASMDNDDTMDETSEPGSRSESPVRGYHVDTTSPSSPLPSSFPPSPSFFGFMKGAFEKLAEGKEAIENIAGGLTSPKAPEPPTVHRRIPTLNSALEDQETLGSNISYIESWSGSYSDDGLSMDDTPCDALQNSADRYAATIDSIALDTTMDSNPPLVESDYGLQSTIDESKDIGQGVENTGSRSGSSYSGSDAESTGSSPPKNDSNDQHVEKVETGTDQISDQFLENEIPEAVSSSNASIGGKSSKSNSVVTESSCVSGVSIQLHVANEEEIHNEMEGGVEVAIDLTELSEPDINASIEDSLSIKKHEFVNEDSVEGSGEDAAYADTCATSRFEESGDIKGITLQSKSEEATEKEIRGHSSEVVGGDAQSMFVKENKSIDDEIEDFTLSGDSGLVFSVSSEDSESSVQRYQQISTLIPLSSPDYQKSGEHSNQVGDAKDGGSLSDRTDEDGQDDAMSKHYSKYHVSSETEISVEKKQNINSPAQQESEKKGNEEPFIEHAKIDDDALKEESEMRTESEEEAKEVQAKEVLANEQADIKGGQSDERRDTSHRDQLEVILQEDDDDDGLMDFGSKKILSKGRLGDINEKKSGEVTDDVFANENVIATFSKLSSVGSDLKDEYADEHNARFADSDDEDRLHLEGKDQIIIPASDDAMSLNAKLNNSLAGHVHISDKISRYKSTVVQKSSLPWWLSNKTKESFVEENDEADVAGKIKAKWFMQQLQQSEAALLERPHTSARQTKQRSNTQQSRDIWWHIPDQYENLNKPDSRIARAWYFDAADQENDIDISTFDVSRQEDCNLPTTQRRKVTNITTRSWLVESDSREKMLSGVEEVNPSSGISIEGSTIKGEQQPVEIVIPESIAILSDAPQSVESAITVLKSEIAQAIYALDDGNTYSDTPVTFKNPVPNIASHELPNSNEILKKHTKRRKTFESKYITPKPHIRDLLEAVNSDSASRRSNASGTLKLMASQKKNVAMLGSSLGLLDSLVRLAKIEAIGADYEAILVSRNRALISIALICQGKENRRAICEHSDLINFLSDTIKSNDHEGRLHSCSAIAALAKTEENRDMLAEKDGLIEELAKLLASLKESGLESLTDEERASMNMARVAAEKKIATSTRLNACAALLHLSKQCTVSVRILIQLIFRTKHHDHNCTTSYKSTSLLPNRSKCVTTSCF